VYPRITTDTTRRLLIAGIIAFAIALGAWLFYAFSHVPNYTQDPVDLKVYVDSGRIVRHLSPYNGKLEYPLYDWGGSTSLQLKFTYPPFPAVFFVLATFVPWKYAPDLSIVINIVLLVVALWFTAGGLGYRDRRVRIGLALLVAGLTFWMQPVLRTMYLGQVNLVLMALILWDLGQPSATSTRTRWWKGIGTGVAAGVTLVPGAFIVYLIFARRFREAIAAIGGFVGTVVIGFIVLPKDSAKYWFTGLFLQGKRTGFTGWEGNQSLDGLITRLSGSIAGGFPIYLAAAALTLILGAAAAAMLDRAGHPMPAIVTAAFAGLLVSPISWDHMWVWVVPAVLILGHYAVRFWPTARTWAYACYAAAAVLLLAFFAWPTAWFEKVRPLGNDSLGLLWMGPDTNPQKYVDYGDQKSFVEYHWHGFQLLWGNIYVLVGLAALAAMILVSLRLRAGATVVLDKGRSDWKTIRERGRTVTRPPAASGAVDAADGS
jgi:alpha-1,2-mannosyltransferase